MATPRDLEGKTMVVTGATSGIGRAAATELVARGAYVLGVGRSPERCAEAAQAMAAADPAARVTFFLADLASQRQIHEVAAQIREHVAEHCGGKLDVLVNNAGTVASWYTATEDGYEMQFAVNHLAPFLLTHELLPVLQAAAPDPSGPAGEPASVSRVVTVASWSHRRARIHWADVMLRRHYNVLRAYKQSKLANVMFSAEFNRRFAADGRVRAYVADPGLVNTEIGLKGTRGIARWVWARRSRKGASAADGAATVVFLAADPSVDGATQLYWKACRPVSPSPYALREEEGARLWGLSARLCGLDG